MHKINCRMQVLLTATMLEACYTTLPNHHLQSFVHTESCRKWIRNQIKVLIASTFQSTDHPRHETFGGLQVPKSQNSVRQHYNSSQLAASLAKCAAQKRPGCRVFYFNCAWALESADFKMNQSIRKGRAEQDSTPHGISLALALLLLQIIRGHPQSEQLLLQYAATLPESGFSEFITSLLEDGLPPSRHISLLVDYLLTNATWGESVLAISNIWLIKPSGQAALLKYFEERCATPKVKACITAPLRRHITTLYSQLPVIFDDTEYEGTWGIERLYSSKNLPLTSSRIPCVAPRPRNGASKNASHPCHGRNK